MAPDIVLKALVCLGLLAGTTVSMPSFDQGSFDSGSILPLGGILNARSDGPFEVRGVYGGRKKRYIVERKEACCKNKPICLSVVGEFIKDCKCTKCPAGKVPAPGGASCQDNCPQGTAMVRVLIEYADSIQ